MDCCAGFFGLLLNDMHSFTAAQNMRSPGYLVCCTWVQEIWSSYGSEEIRNSFKYCGIHQHIDAEATSEIAVNASRLHSVEPIAKAEVNFPAPFFFCYANSRYGFAVNQRSSWS